METKRQPWHSENKENWELSFCHFFFFFTELSMEDYWFNMQAI